MNDEHLRILKSGVEIWNSARERAEIEIPDLSGANLRGMWLAGVNLSRANLVDADLSFANLRNADLRQADLTGASLSTAGLSGALIDTGNFSASTDKLRAVQRKTVALKILESLKFDLPSRRAKVFRVHFDGEVLRLDGKPLSTEESFAQLMAHIERVLRESLASGRFSNTAPQIELAMSAYLYALDGYYRGEGEISLGLSGHRLTQEINAFQSTDGKDFPELSGALNDITFSQAILERLLPDWQGFMKDLGMGDYAEVPLGELVFEVNDVAIELAKTGKVDEKIPETLRILIAFAKDPMVKGKELGFAMIRGVEDVIMELFTFLFELYGKTKGHLVNVGSAVAAASIIVALAQSTGLTNLIAGNPKMLSWVEHALKWLKGVGLMD